MANCSAIGHVSYPRHDGVRPLRQTAYMAKRPRQPWYLKEWRQHRGWTQDELADKTGLSKPFISQLERGRRQYTPETLELLADALNCDTAALLKRNPRGDDAVWAFFEDLTQPERAQAITVIRALKASAGN